MTEFQRAYVSALRWVAYGAVVAVGILVTCSTFYQHLNGTEW